MFIVRDTREKAGIWTFADTICEGIVVKKLDTGDYSIQGLEDKLCIERKSSATEFCNNCIDARFKRELQRMEAYEFRFIIFEFDVDDIMKFPIGSHIPKSKWAQLRISNKLMMRSISEIQVNHNIHVIFAGDRDNAIYVASNIMKRVYDKYKVNN